MLPRFRQLLCVALIFGAAAAVWRFSLWEHSPAAGENRTDPKRAHSTEAPAVDEARRPDRLSRIDPANPPSNTIPARLDAAGFPLDPGVRRQTYVQVDIPLAALAAPEVDSRPLSGFTIPVFDGEDIEVEIDRHESTDEHSGCFVGHVAGKPGSFVILGYDGEAEAGTVQIPEEGYLLSITYAGEGVLRIAELDPHHLPGCGQPRLPPHG